MKDASVWDGVGRTMIALMSYTYAKKNVLHILEGPDGEGAGEISIHVAGGGIGEGSVAEHILNRAGFLRGRHVVDLLACGDDVGLGVTRGSCVRAMPTHVALVRSSRAREMGAY